MSGRHPCIPRAEWLETIGCSFVVTNGQSKEEFHKDRPFSRARHRMHTADDVANTLALLDGNANVKAFMPRGYAWLDIDKHKADGFKSLADAGYDLPDTYTERTPTDGAHLALELPEDCHTFNGKIQPLPGVDVMSGPNHPVLIAGSVIRGKGRYTVTRDSHIAQAPAWFADIIRAHLTELERQRVEREQWAAARANAKKVTHHADIARYMEKAISNACANVFAAKPGNRRKVLIETEAYGLGGYTPHYASVTEITEQLMKAAAGYERADRLEKEIRKAVEKGSETPRYVYDLDAKEITRKVVAAMRAARDGYRGWGGKITLAKRGITVPLADVLAVVEAAFLRAEKTGDLGIQLSVRMAGEISRMSKATANRALWGAQAIDLMTKEGGATESKGNSYRLNLSAFNALMLAGNDNITGNSQIYDKKLLGDGVEQGKTVLAELSPPVVICPSFEKTTVASWAELGAFERPYKPSNGKAHYEGLGRPARVICEALATLGAADARAIADNTGAALSTVYRLMSRLVQLGVVERLDGKLFAFTADADAAIRRLVSVGDGAAKRHTDRRELHKKQRKAFHDHQENERNKRAGRATEAQSLDADTIARNDELPADQRAIVPNPNCVRDESTEVIDMNDAQTVRLVRRITVTEEFEAVATATKPTDKPSTVWDEVLQEVTARPTAEARPGAG